MCENVLSSGTDRKSSWSSHLSRRVSTASGLQACPRRSVSMRSRQICRADRLTSTARIQSSICKSSGLLEIKRSTAGKRKSTWPADGSKSRNEARDSDSTIPRHQERTRPPPGAYELPRDPQRTHPKRRSAHRARASTLGKGQSVGHHASR